MLSAGRSINPTAAAPISSAGLYGCPGIHSAPTIETRRARMSIATLSLGQAARLSHSAMISILGEAINEWLQTRVATGSGSI